MSTSGPRRDRWLPLAWFTVILLATVTGGLVISSAVAGDLATVSGLVTSGAAALSAVGGLLAGTAAWVTARHARRHGEPARRHAEPAGDRPRGQRGRAELAETSARSAEQRTRLLVARTLTPLGYLLGEIADARPGSAQRDKLRRDAIRAVLSSTVEVLDEVPVCACFLALSADGTELVLDGYYGKPLSVVALPRLALDTGPGTGALRSADVLGVQYYADLAERGPAWWATLWFPDGAPVGRRGSLVVAPVGTDGRRCGLVTVDAREPGAFSERDADLLELMATLLGVALRR